jgi:hypothetical protein
MRYPPFALAGLLALAAALGGCGNSSPSEKDVAAALSKAQPNASDVSCTHSHGDFYECSATVDGKKTLFHVAARGGGVYINASPNQ